MNRTDENRTIAVVRTRLPYTDRRSLSQAWFSALHLNDGPPAMPAPRPGRAPGGALVAHARARPPAGPGTAHAAGETRSPAPRHRDTVALAPAGGGDDVATPGERREVESCATLRPRARSLPPLRTSLTVGVGGERVALVLRRDGATLHVVAVCRPGVESAVRHALARAAAEVRRHGESLQASVRAMGGRRP